MSKRKILITGKGSYVGTNFIKWLEQWPDQYEVEELSVRGSAWKEHDFSKFDVVLHVAGIAHVSTDPKMEEQYYKVNRDLTIEVASKAKKDNVKQFIFMSSIIVYGDSNPIGRKRIIGKNTIPQPSNFYGNSKLLAENAIKDLESSRFKIVIIRPPMIYGKGSKGNYSRLSAMAKKTLFFPDIDNERSMLHIDNLTEFIKLMIKNEEHGIFYPQNKEYVKTSEMVKLIAVTYGKKVHLTKMFNSLLRIFGSRIAIINKMFGNLVYEKNLSYYKHNYQIRGLSKSIELSELGSEK